MTTLPVADRLIELFNYRQTQHDRIATELLTLATDADFVSMRVAGCAEDVGVVLECEDSSHVVGSKEAGPLRVFRTLLTHFAKLAETEHGIPANSFGERLRIEQTTSRGRVRLNIEFANTSDLQYLAITKG